MKRLFLATLMIYSLTATAQSELYPEHFDLEEVTLLDGPLKTAQELNTQVLMQYDVCRLLTPFVRQAGLASTTDTTSPYYQWTTLHPNFPNWGGDAGFDLSGHIGGHYMTALALAYAATQDATVKAQLTARIDTILAVLSDCQAAFDNDQTGLYGFIGGQPMNANWQALYKGDVSGFWSGSQAVPFYCQHKVLAGLRDLALYTEDDVVTNFLSPASNRTSSRAVATSTGAAASKGAAARVASSIQGQRATVARELFKKLSDWSVNLISNLTDSQLQDILNTEHGGMNETLVDAYRMFGDQKYLTAAKRYSHQSMVSGMQTQSATFLDNKHANTQVPKYIGFQRIAQEDATATTYKTAALNFWQDVTGNRTVCIGGNSVNEHFLSASNCGNYISELDGPESCNSNNMLKLSEDLFDTYHESRFADFYETAMYNHILSTQDPETGGYVYFTPLRPEQYRIYSKPNQDMWCCVGTGMENHEKYGHFIYTHNDNTLYVNLFVPSQLTDEQFALTQETQFPQEPKTRLTIDKDGTFTLAIRRPSWVAEGFGVTLNGTAQDVSGVGEDGYYRLTNSFAKGDVVEVSLPMALRYEAMPNQSDYIAFKYGPVLLGARTTKVYSSSSTDSQTATTETSASDESDLPYEALTHEYAAGERMGHSPNTYTQKSDLSLQPMLLGDRSEVLQRITKVERKSAEDTGKDLTFTLDCRRTDEYASGYTWTTLTLEPYYTLHHSRTSIYFYQQTLDAYLNSTWAQEEKQRRELEARTVDQVDMGKQQSEAGVVTSSSDSNTGTYRDEDYRDTQKGGWMQIVLTDTLPDAQNLSLILRYTTADKGRTCSIYVNDQLLKDYTVPSTASGANSNGFYNLELPLGALAYDASGNRQTTFTVRIVASGTTANPGLYYIRLMKDYPAYKFQAADWSYTGDTGRMAQSKIATDETANTITMTQSGTNNICLKYGTSRTCQVPLDQHYLVIRGTNLKTTSGSAYLWWLNGTNKSSQVAPTSTATLDDGRTQLVWDITQSGLDAHCNTDPWTLTIEYNALSTLFGLTAKTSTKPVTISYIGFLSDEQLAGTTPEPEGDTTPVRDAASPTERRSMIFPETQHLSTGDAASLFYAPSGIASSHPQRGINILRTSDGKSQKVVY